MSGSLDLFDLKIWLARPRADYSVSKVLSIRRYTAQVFIQKELAIVIRALRPQKREAGGGRRTQPTRTKIVDHGHYLFDGKISSSLHHRHSFT